ncbi:hypothetical protein [Microvirga massiliensis]|uniref:hypothetical protein n=1 Tax=Microvirga massiliensis TaxID=1033741 RepID=UPI00062B45A5|nr:hypothetical protein [Microvirga massiliensis]
MQTTTEIPQPCDRAAVDANGKAIKIQYRDENYGSIFLAVAFRFGSRAHLTDEEIEMLNAAAESAGFSFNYQRCSWIHEFAQDAAQATAALESAIKEAGFDLANA